LERVTFPVKVPHETKGCPPPGWNRKSKVENPCKQEKNPCIAGKINTSWKRKIILSEYLKIGRFFKTGNKY
jgi:hypothetical protein